MSSKPRMASRDSCTSSAKVNVHPSTWNTRSLRGKDCVELVFEVMRFIESVEFSNKFDTFPVRQ